MRRSTSRLDASSDESSGRERDECVLQRGLLQTQPAQLDGEVAEPRQNSSPFDTANSRRARWSAALPKTVCNSCVALASSAVVSVTRSSPAWHLSSRRSLGDQLPWSMMARRSQFFSLFHVVGGQKDGHLLALPQFVQAIPHRRRVCGSSPESARRGKARVAGARALVRLPVDGACRREVRTRWSASPVRPIHNSASSMRAALTAWHTINHAMDLQILRAVSRSSRRDPER